MTNAKKPAATPEIVVNRNITTNFDATDVIKKLPVLKTYQTKHIAAAFDDMNPKTLRRQMRARNVRIGSGKRHSFTKTECHRLIKLLTQPVIIE